MAIFGVYFLIYMVRRAQGAGSLVLVRTTSVSTSLSSIVNLMRRARQVRCSSPHSVYTARHRSPDRAWIPRTRRHMWRVSFRAIKAYVWSLKLRSSLTVADSFFLVLLRVWPQSAHAARRAAD